jgi:excinuclease ABC subunit C
LLREFGSVRRLRSATVAEVAEVPGIGLRTAEAIVAALADPADTVNSEAAEVAT